MAKPNLVTQVVESLSVEEQLQDLPEYPTRPMLFDSDYPTGELASQAQAKFNLERSEREYQTRAAMSGYLAEPWGERGALSPAERELERERQEDVRRYRNGLPDSPEDMAPRVGDKGRPF